MELFQQHRSWGMESLFAFVKLYIGTKMAMQRRLGSSLRNNLSAFPTIFQKFVLSDAYIYVYTGYSHI
jgi:hypothetical protein